MPRKPKRPDVSKITVLYAAYWPSTGTFYVLEDFFPRNLDAVATAETPAILHGDVAAYRRAEGRTKRRYWIVKYIPVAVLDTEYKQQRIPPAVSSA